MPIDWNSIIYSLVDGVKIAIPSFVGGLTVAIASIWISISSNKAREKEIKAIKREKLNNHLNDLNKKHLDEISILISQYVALLDWRQFDLSTMKNHDDIFTMSEKSSETMKDINALYIQLRIKIKPYQEYAKLFESTLKYLQTGFEKYTLSRKSHAWLCKEPLESELRRQAIAEIKNSENNLILLIEKFINAARQYIDYENDFARLYHQFLDE